MMIETQSELTLSLATAAGAYFIAGGLTGFTARDKWGVILNEITGSPALVFLSGVFAFVLGAALIMTHNIWTDALAGFISFVGWAAAIEGLALLVFPDPLLKISQSFMRPGFITIFAGFTVVLGAVLLFAGLTGTAR